jgi:exodeoxyribonuclease VII small subunit
MFMTTGDGRPESETPTFEQAMLQLSEIVRALEEGNLSLDDSLRKYELGIRCLNQCQEKLAMAEQRIEALSGFDADGNPVTQRVENEELTLQQKADSRSRRRTARSSKSTAAVRDTGPAAHQGDQGDQGDVDAGGTLF